MNDNPMKKVKPLYVSAVSTLQAFTEKEIQVLFSVPWLSTLARLVCLYWHEIRGSQSALRNGHTGRAVVISHSIDVNGGIKSIKSGRVRICPLPTFLGRRTDKIDVSIFMLRIMKLFSLLGQVYDNK